MFFLMLKVKLLTLVVVFKWSRFAEFGVGGVLFLA